VLGFCLEVKVQNLIMKLNILFLSLLLFTAIPSFSQNIARNATINAMETDSTFIFHQINEKDYYDVMQVRHNIVNDRTDTVIAGLNLNHSKKSDKNKLEVIDDAVFKLYNALMRLDIDKPKQASENINATVNVFDNDKKRILPKFLNVSLYNYNGEAEQTNISIDSNVVKDFHPEYQPIDYSKEIPGQVPNGVTFLSVDLMKGKTWIHRMEIKE
jgi:hypothetical protein